MAPKPTDTREKRQKTRHEGQSSRSSPQSPQANPPPTWDRAKFLTRSKFERFRDITHRKLLPERQIQLAPEEYSDFLNELERRHWQFLTFSSSNINPEIVKEFYANAYPIQRGTDHRQSWVRGRHIEYNRDAINNLLGNPLTMAEGEVCTYQRLRRLITGFDDNQVAASVCVPGTSYEPNPGGAALIFKRKNLKTLAQIWLVFLCSCISPSSHTSDLRMYWARLLYCIISQLSVDIATVITEEIHKIVLSSSSRPLGFPALITALCAAQGVPIPAHPSHPFREPLTAQYIRNHCLNRLEQADPAHDPAPGDPAPQATPPPHMTDMDRLTAHLDFLHLQMAATHRAYTSLHQQMFQSAVPPPEGSSSSLPWLTPADFAAHVSWPGDRPIFPGGESDQGQQAGADEGDQGYRPEFEPGDDDGGGQIDEDFLADAMEAELH